MKKLTAVLIIAIFFSAICLQAQNNVLLEIDDVKITTDEFLHIYKKNNTSPEAMSLNAMNEYMDLFINFKLKVHEAKALGLDTTSKFLNELAGYRSQLSQPYLTDKQVEEELVREAYERMLWDVDVSHILVKVDQMALPNDTLKAHKKIQNIYAKLKKGEKFEKLAVEFSEDESVVNNQGNLGYRTVFGLVYPFETAMYKTEPGKYSEPFRTNFGYHILKVHDKRPAKGRYRVAHIMLMTPPEAGQALKDEAERKIYELKALLTDGVDFEELTKKESQDRRSAEKGGDLGWVSVGGRMIQVFENAVFEMNEVGQISEPLRTSYGWHIIKVLEIEPIKEFDELQREIKSKISNTARASKSKESIIAKLKKEYNFKEDVKSLELFYTLVTDSIFYGTWTMDENTDLSKEIISFADRKYTQEDFYRYISKFNRKQTVQPLKTFVDQSFRGFSDKMIMMYEEEILEEKYPDFKYLIQEYHDGILLFELTDLMVWSKAIRDTAGLEAFHNTVKNNYMWDYRYDVKIFESKNHKIADKLNKALNKNQDIEKILSKLNKKDAENVLVIMQGKFEKGTNAEIDELISLNNIPVEKGFRKVIYHDDNKISLINVVEPQPKKLSEARGLITADYQNYLEKQWIDELRSKYKIKLHRDVLKSIVK